MFSNFIHLNTIPLMQDELQQVLNLNLNYFNPNEEYWSWTDNRSIDISLNENDSFITNISFYTKQLEEIQILFVEKYNGDNNFTVVKRFFEIPANEVLSFQNVMILGIHHNSIKNPNQGFHNINIDMTISNAATESEKAKRGKVPIWETLFGIVLPLVPDINSLDPFIPQEIIEPDYSGLVTGITDLIDTNTEGFVQINEGNTLEVQEIDSPANSHFCYYEDIILGVDYPQNTYGENLGSTISDWDIYNFGGE